MHRRLNKCVPLIPDSGTRRQLSYCPTNFAWFPVTVIHCNQCNFCFFFFFFAHAVPSVGPPGQHTGLSSGSTAGVVIGVIGAVTMLLIFIIIAALIFIWWKKQQLKKGESYAVFQWVLWFCSLYVCMDSIVLSTELRNFHVNISIHMTALSIALLFFLCIESDHEKGERASLASFSGFRTPGCKYVYMERGWSFFSRKHDII